MGVEGNEHHGNFKVHVGQGEAAFHENGKIKSNIVFVNAKEGLLGNLLNEDQQWAKLQLVVDTARRLWG